MASASSKKFLDQQTEGCTTTWQVEDQLTFLGLLEPPNNGYLGPGTSSVQLVETTDEDRQGNWMAWRLFRQILCLFFLTAVWDFYTFLLKNQHFLNVFLQ